MVRNSNFSNNAQTWRDSEASHTENFTLSFFLSPNSKPRTLVLVATLLYSTLYGHHQRRSRIREYERSVFVENVGIWLVRLTTVKRLHLFGQSGLFALMNKCLLVWLYEAANQNQSLIIWILALTSSVTKSKGGQDTVGLWANFTPSRPRSALYRAIPLAHISQEC